MPAAASGPPRPSQRSRDELIAELVRKRIWQLKNLLRAQDELSEPVPPGHWRWADVNNSGYGRKTEEELAADRARATAKAAELRAELAVLEGE